MEKVTKKQQILYFLYSGKKKHIENQNDPKKYHVLQAIKYLQIAYFRLINKSLFRKETKIIYK